MVLIMLLLDRDPHAASDEPTDELAVFSGDIAVPTYDAGLESPEITWPRLDQAREAAFAQVQQTHAHLREEIVPWLDNVLTPQFVDGMIHAQSLAFADDNAGLRADELIQQATHQYFAESFGDDFMDTRTGQAFYDVVSDVSVGSSGFDRWQVLSEDPHARDRRTEDFVNTIYYRLHESAVYDNAELNEACQRTVELLDGDIQATITEIAQIERDLEVPGIRFSATWRHYEQARKDLGSLYQEKMNLITRYHMSAGMALVDASALVDRGDEGQPGLGDELRNMGQTIAMKKAEIDQAQTPSDRRKRVAKRIAGKCMRVLGAKEPVNTTFTSDDVDSMVVRARIEARGLVPKPERTPGVQRSARMGRLAAAAVLLITGVSATNDGVDAFIHSKRSDAPVAAEPATGDQHESTDSWIGTMVSGLKPSHTQIVDIASTGSAWEGVQSMSGRDVEDMKVTITGDKVVYHPKAGDGWIDVLVGTGLSQQAAEQTYYKNPTWFASQPESYVMPDGNAGIDMGKVPDRGIDIDSSLLSA